MARIPASESTRKRIKEMMTTGGLDQSAMLREAVRLIIEEALEAEVTQASGRGYCAHDEGRRGQAQRTG